MPTVKLGRRVGAVALATSLAGCANAGSGVSNVSVASALGRSHMVVRPDAVSPAVLQPRMLAPSFLGAAPTTIDDARAGGRMYLSTPLYGGTAFIYPLDGNDKTFIGVMTNVLDPFGSAVDSKGSIYLASFLLNTISLFAPHAISPFQVLQNPYTPNGIAVSPTGIVYAANIFNNTLTVFAPGATKPADSLRDSKLVSPFYTTVDTKGNVYADGLDCQEKPQQRCSGNTVIGYYPAGSHTFMRRDLPIGFPGGLKVDRQGNLLVIDQAPPGGGASVLDVFPPSATKPSQVYTLTGADVLDVAIDQNEDRFYTADYTYGESVGYTYPGGKNILTIVAPNYPNDNVQSVTISPPNVP
jgi:hypothetical protein